MLTIAGLGYDSDAFHSISSLDNASQRFHESNGIDFVQIKLKSLILEHGVQDLFGVALVHRHFDLEEGTILVEKDMVTAPWRYNNSFAKFGGTIVPNSWFCSEGTVQPYEFCFVPSSKSRPAKLEEHSSFVKDFFETITSHRLGRFIGLRRLSGMESPEMLECTEGNVNIMFRSDEVSLLISPLVRHLADVPRLTPSTFKTDARQCGSSTVSHHTACIDACVRTRGVWRTQTIIISTRIKPSSYRYVIRYIFSPSETF